jgi:putative cell wall-binding protein
MDTKRIGALLLAMCVSLVTYGLAAAASGIRTDHHDVIDSAVPLAVVAANIGLCSNTANVSWETNMAELTVTGVFVDVPGCGDDELVGLQLLTDDGDIPSGDPLLTRSSADRAFFDIAHLDVGIMPVTGMRVFLEDRAGQPGPVRPTPVPVEPSPTPGPVDPTPTPGPVEPTPTPGPVDPTPTPTPTPPGEDVGGIVIERIDRWAGPTRIETATEISREAFPDGARVVYLATSHTFPDALTGGAAAASVPGPILLTQPDSLPAVTAAEIARLAPSRIVILGGTAAVSEGVAADLARLGPHLIERIGGPERVATAALTSAAHFPPGVPVAYIATAFNFPDALSGGAAAARDGGPVLLVTDEVPAVTAAELERLRPGRIVVLGGTVAVSEAVKTALEQFTSGEVERVAGVDRFATSAMIAATFPTPTHTVFIATGANFPDALAGVPAAATLDAPILLVHRDEIPDVVLDQIRRLTPTRIVILGGTAAISLQVEQQLQFLRFPAEALNRHPG